MKRLHRPDLFGWSVFNTERNIDFHSLVWVRPQGNIVVDPLPMSEHDRAHLDSLGPIAFVVITNSDHMREAVALREASSAQLLGPAGERQSFPVACDGWLLDGDEIVPGLTCIALAGSKTPGELALVLEESTLITGDLVRAHEGGRLTILPEKKLANRELAAQSVARLAALPRIETVLVGDGWPVFRHGGEALRELSKSLARNEGASNG